MLTENGIEVDLQALDELLGKADVLTIGFTLFPERLLIDTRTRDNEGPMVAIVEPVATVQERYLWLGKHRGSFGAPADFSFFVWPHTVRNFRERSILAVMRERLAASRGSGVAQLEDALARLAQSETDAIREAIRGSDRWPAVWERAAG
jgi:hypothetical protein